MLAVMFIGALATLHICFTICFLYSRTSLIPIKQDSQLSEATQNLVENEIVKSHLYCCKSAIRKKKISPCRTVSSSSFEHCMSCFLACPWNAVSRPLCCYASRSYSLHSKHRWWPPRVYSVGLVVAVNTIRSSLSLSQQCRCRDWRNTSALQTCHLCHWKSSWSALFVVHMESLTASAGGLLFFFEWACDRAVYGDRFFLLNRGAFKTLSNNGSLRLPQRMNNKGCRRGGPYYTPCSYHGKGAFRFTGGSEFQHISCDADECRHPGWSPTG